MIEFIKQHIFDIIEILLGFVAGFVGGKEYYKRNCKNTAKIKGNNNNIVQKG